MAKVCVSCGKLFLDKVTNSLLLYISFFSVPLKCRRGREGRHPSFFVSFLERGISYSHKVVFHVLKTSCTRLAFMSISR